MRASTFGERKLTELDFTRFKKSQEPTKGYIPVLAPAGMGLIGLPVGVVARRIGPGGEESVAQIEGILFQPEAIGDYVT
jgi:regulator of nucleoside diphosphate kinase